MTNGRAKVVGWTVLALSGLAFLLWLLDQPQVTQLQWGALAGFVLLWALAMDARSEVRALRSRVDALERKTSPR